MVKNICMKSYKFTKSYYCNNCGSFFLAKKILKHYEITTKDGKIIYGIDNLFCPTCGSFNVKMVDKCATD